MTKARRRYSREFKLEALRLLESSGLSAAQIERDLDIGDGCLLQWKKQFGKAGEHAFPGQGVLSPEQEEMRRLRRENEVLRQERDILKKAVAIFSRPRE
jgi:transposase